MAVTALQLIQATNLDPAYLGSSIITAEDLDQKKAQMVTWVDESVLPLALSEVETPWHELTGTINVDQFVNEQFPHLSPTQKESAIKAGGNLFDKAVVTYGVEMLNANINSGAKVFKDDAAVARTTGAQTVAKLVAWGTKMIATGGRPNVLPTPPSDGRKTLSVGTTSVRVRRSW